MANCLDDNGTIQDAIFVLEKLNLDSPLYDEEYNQGIKDAKFVVLENLYEQLEAHIEQDILEYTKPELKKLYHKKFIDKYDILNRRG